MCRLQLPHDGDRLDVSTDMNELFRLLEEMDDATLCGLVKDLKWYAMRPRGVPKGDLSGPNRLGYHLRPLHPWLVDDPRKVSVKKFPDDVLNLIDTYLALRLSP